MGNRFVRRIKSGDIGTVDDLKSEFKALAKLTHPDVRASAEGEGAQAEFVAMRSEFEHALRDFEKHRFGARGALGPLPGPDGPLADETWPCLALLLKRGFPKNPRHEKELLRYDYARWRLEQALGGELVELFGRFESELLFIRAAEMVELDAILEFLRDLIEYRSYGLPSMRTHVVLCLGRLRAALGVGEAVLDFIGRLALELGIGAEIGAR